MREIKFRAWNSECGKMAYDVHTEYDTIAGVEYTDGTEPYMEKFNDYITNDNWTLMQYAGLKDKNSREIYEGDVIGDNSFADDHSLWKAIVYWSESGAWNIKEVTGDKGIAMLVAYNPTHECEVIGNIYENPDLL